MEVIKFLIFWLNPYLLVLIYLLKASLAAPFITSMTFILLKDMGLLIVALVMNAASPHWSHVYPVQEGNHSVLNSWARLWMPPHVGRQTPQRKSEKNDSLQQSLTAAWQWIPYWWFSHLHGHILRTRCQKLKQKPRGSCTEQKPFRYSCVNTSKTCLTCRSDRNMNI